MNNQHDAPLASALSAYRKNRIVPFDVPGHKQGRGAPELCDFLGKPCLSVDVNSMKPLDNLAHPTSVIREAEELAADAFGANHAFFMVGGTTSAVQAMILSVCKRGDEIIMPRNVHISALNALVLCGAIPVYVNPGENKRLGIPLGMSREAVAQAIAAHPGAKAVFVNNPTYYGIASDLKSICALAHENGMLLLADEAHGTHLYFGENLPACAIKCGADMAAVSMHKTGGSLTQSSILLISKSQNPGHVRKTIALTQTTSASYLLLSSLDIARRNLALNGAEIFRRVCALGEYARREINSIGGFYAYSSEICDGDAAFAFDTTKLSVLTRDIGRAGIEVYDMLRDEFGIQVEFGDISNILAIISVGDTEQNIERLVSALYEIKRLCCKDTRGMLESEYHAPRVIMSPQQAYYAEKRTLPLDECAGHICGEFAMCYPPGIPVLAPGEEITPEICEYIRYAKLKGCLITGTDDLSVNTLRVVSERS